MRLWMTAAVARTVGKGALPNAHSFAARCLGLLQRELVDIGHLLSPPV
jgi:hypothetical protein